LFAIFPLKKILLKHYHYDIFQPFEITKKGIDTAENNELRFNFKTNDVGEIDNISVKLEPSVKAIEFRRQPDVVNLDKDALKKYTGEFAIGDFIAKVYTRKDQQLFLFVPGQPEYELVSTGANKFLIKSLDGYKIEFTEGENGKIAGLIFIQPNGNFKAVKK